MKNNLNFKHTEEDLQELRQLLSVSKPLRARLQDFVKFLAYEFNVKSSGIYLLNSDYVLESYVYHDREEGAQPESKFRVGEGILGYILSTGTPTCVDNLMAHPNFVYRPGATDYIYLALVGYPIATSRGRVGVLTIQNELDNPFSEDVLALLQPYVNLLSELPELEKTFTFHDNDNALLESLTLEGIAFSGGVGMGEVFVHSPRSWTRFKSSQNVNDERGRLKRAIRDMMASIDSMVAHHNIDEHRDPKEILETYKMFAADRGWIKKIQTHIQEGLTAEAAVDLVRCESRDKYGQVGDKYLKGHLADLEDLANRIIAHLMGENPDQKDTPKDMIVIARQMGPAELLDYDHRNLRGVILEEGIHTSHMAIVARALGIPVVGRIHNALKNINPGQKVVVNGEDGTIIINPDETQIQESCKKSELFSQWKTDLRELQDVPALTQDGISIHLQLNAGLMVDLQYLHEAKVEGIGLYRTEIPFMMYSKFPNVETQTRLYSDVLDHAHGKPVTFRTLDLGGDKTVPYMWRVTDENPAMGWRAIRVSLDRPALLKQQLRALVMAASARDLNVMFPLITTAGEYLKAKSFLTEELARGRSRGQVMPTSVRCGLMIETPSIVWELDTIASEVDFLSLGTNDLFQFFFACDRMNPNLAHRYDPLRSSYLNFLKMIHEKAARYHLPINVCGEMARQPLETMALIGLGYRSFSMNVPAIPTLKKCIRQMDVSKVETLIEEELGKHTPSLREALRKM